jgi:hypothetical protein
MLHSRSNRLVSALLFLALGASSSMAAETPHRLAPASFAGLTRSTIRAEVHGAKEPTLYEGVSLGDLVRKLGAPAGEAIRGAQLSLVVIVKAADGYQVVFALPELDPLFSKKVVLLADRRDGQALSAKEGPYRLVVPDEGRQARWARQVVSIELRTLP